MKRMCCCIIQASQGIRERWPCLFWVARVIEEDGQFDATVTELWPARMRGIAGIQVRRSVIRRKKNQRLQKSQHGTPVLVRQSVECRRRPRGLASMTQNHFGEIDTPSVVPVRGSAANP